MWCMAAARSAEAARLAEHGRSDCCRLSKCCSLSVGAGHLSVPCPQCCNVTSSSNRHRHVAAYGQRVPPTAVAGLKQLLRSSRVQLPASSLLPATALLRLPPPARCTMECCPLNSVALAAACVCHPHTGALVDKLVWLSSCSPAGCVPRRPVSKQCCCVCCRRPGQDAKQTHEAARRLLLEQGAPSSVRVQTALRSGYARESCALLRAHGATGVRPMPHGFCKLTCVHWT
jgi:hypothetical protein